MLTPELLNYVNNVHNSRERFQPELLHARRVDHGLTITDVAALVGVRERTAERYETGTCAPQDRHLARVDRLLAGLAGQGS